VLWGMGASSHRPQRAVLALPGHAADVPVSPDIPRDREAGTSALFEAHYRHLVALARRMLDDPADAEDVVMDAFAGAYARWTTVRNLDNPFFYLRKSVVNGCNNRSRRLRTAGARLLLRTERASPPADLAAMTHFEHEAVVSALRELKGRQHQVLVLRYYEGLSEHEIAETLGCSLGSIKTHAHRGLRALAAKLGES
jgi:RNA polymerase sigma-70 factor (sigma-E family)